MYLYLKHGGAVKRLARVHLDRCFQPNVGSFFEDRIEPSLWYKILVLDAVFIDCDVGRKRVYWSSDKGGASIELHGVRNRLLSASAVQKFFRDKEIVLEDELDPTYEELFDIASDIFSRLDIDHDEKGGGRNSNEVAYKHTIRLLHVYILPNIKFGKKVKSAVQDTLRIIKKEELEIETLIQHTVTDKQNMKEALRVQRKDLLGSRNFSSVAHLTKVDINFLEVFLHHIVEDIERTRKYVQSFEDHIHPLRNCETQEDKKKLEQLRAKRNNAHVEFEQILNAREEIVNYLSRKSKEKLQQNGKSKKVMFFPIYLQLSVRINQQDTETRLLIDRKLKVATVREAAEQTLKEIEQFGDSLGYSCRKGSIQCRSDIVNPGQKPEMWATLRDRINNLLNNNRLHFGTTCRMFWLKVRDEITSKLSVASVTEENAVTVDICETECKCIQDHLEDMAMKIAVQLTGGSETSVNIPHDFVSKVFICYERHVSCHLMELLGELFEKGYGQKCSDLSAWIARQSPSLFCHRLTPCVWDERLPIYVDVIQELDAARSFVDKLRQVTALIKSVENFINKQETLNGDGACSDDFVDLVVQLLTKLDLVHLLKLYSQVKIVEILLPDFLMGTSHCYSLVTVNVSFQHLFSQMETNSTEC